MFQTFITRHNSNFFSDFFFQAEDGIRYYKVTGVQTCAFFFQAEDGIRDYKVTGVQTCALPISLRPQPAAVATAVARGAGYVRAQHRDGEPGRGGVQPRRWERPARPRGLLLP